MQEDSNNKFVIENNDKNNKIENENEIELNNDDI